MMDSNMILINQLSKETLKKEGVDIILKPRLRGARVAEFGKVRELIKEGEIAALRKLPELRKITR